MTVEQQNPTPAAVWYLVSESGAPLGQAYRGRGEAVPAPGARLENGRQFAAAEVVSATELAATCMMRRFRVVVRVLA